MGQEATIPEVSETEMMSKTESITSDSGHTYNEMSLDHLFAELKQLATVEPQDSDEFQSLKKRVENLPKIQADLEKTLQVKLSSQDVVKINDPIVVKAKKEEITTSGDKWFNMKEQELTDEVKRDMLVIKQRSALDPKRHYKKDKWEIPKYFHMGTIIEGNTEFYSARLSKKQRGKNLVDEILHDNDSQKYFKRKYSEIQSQKTSGGKAHYKKVQAMRKKY